MEDNVALDSSKQKKFIKSIKGIKKLIKQDVTVPEKSVEKSVKDGKKKRKFRERGLVYLSHIPHGFYENEMTQYFKQFGKVTNARVIRSRKTGKSKGYAFVEFGQPAVAQIVAETMNNYLMGKRLIKAECIPAEKQRHYAMRKHWSAQNNPSNNLRIQFKKEFNDIKTDEQHFKKAKRLMKNLKQTKEKLKSLGINYDFFTPVDIPEGLQEQVEIKPEKVEAVNFTKKSKAFKELPVDSKIESKLGTGGKKGAVKIAVTEKAKETIKQSKANSKKKDSEEKSKKQLLLKAADVKPVEEFIKVNSSDNSDDDSDGSLVFDSDEFQKSQEFDEEFDSNEGSETDDVDDDETSEGDLPPAPVKVAPKKAGKKLLPPPPPKVKALKQEIKRKAPQKVDVGAKMQKFEKKGGTKKVFKKK